MPLPLRRLVAGVILITFAASCQQLELAMVSMGELVQEGAEQITTRRFEDDPIPLAISGPVSVDVESFGGDVTLRADDTRASGVLVLTRRALHGPGRTEEADRALAEIDLEYALVASEHGPTLNVRASTTSVEPHFLRADIDIVLPAIDGVRVRTRNGDVTAERIEGEVDIVTSDGDVRVLTPRPMVRPVTIINNAGDIDYRVRGESTGAFDCQTVRGRVIHHVEYGRLRVLPGSSFDVLHAVLNEGTNPVVLRAADGDIRVAVVPAPTRVGTFIP